MRTARVSLFAVPMIATMIWVATAAAAGEFTNVSPGELEGLMKAGDAIAIDANGATVRTKHGTVPDAVLLSDYKQYDPTSELPADRDKKLVFYCANTMCGAAPAAAQKAQAAGYDDVAVMTEGIMGWAAAGKAVDKGEAG